LQIARLGLAGAGARMGRALLCGVEMLYGVYAALVFLLCVPPTWALVKLARTRRAAGSVTASALRLYFAVIGVRIRVEGRENLDAAKPCVMVCNHASYADVIALCAALGADYLFVAKQEALRMPFIGTFMRKLGHLAFDRSDAQARLEQANEIEALLRAGESIFVFPEGTFVAHEGVRPFQLGAFKAAVEAGKPVVPIALTGTRHFLRDGTFLPRPARINIRILPALTPSGESIAEGTPADWHEMVRLRDAARADIAEHCGEPAL
ncbi:MAG: lysophospholipid acyltransferase family protein, partial [Bryobacteraceae bacterium]